MKENEIFERKDELSPLPETKLLEGEEEIKGSVLETKKALDDVYRAQWDALSQSGYLSDEEKKWLHDVLTELMNTPYSSQEFSTQSHLATHKREIFFPEEKSNDFNRFITKIETLGFAVEPAITEEEGKEKINETRKTLAKFIKDDNVLEDLLREAKDQIERKIGKITVSNMCAFNNAFS